MTLNFLPPEKPVNRILRLILMNPRWTFGITVGLAVICLGLATLMYAASAKIDSLQTQLTSANATIQGQTDALKLVQDFANARAEAADKAIAIARGAGKADRRAAEVYLNLPVPAPEVRCEAASALVDEALRENRQ